MSTDLVHRHPTPWLAAGLASFAVLALVAACAPQGNRSTFASPGAAEAEAAAAAVAGEDPAPVLRQRKLIRTVEMVVEVDDTDQAAERVHRLADAHDGFVSDLDGWTQGEARMFRITLRVPVASLDAAVADLEALAVRVNRKTVRTQDVTDQYVDLDARLRTLKATEDELRALLAESRQRNQDAEDIMAIYRHLTEIRTQAEQIEGQLRSLANRTSLSTIHIDLRPTEGTLPVVAEAWRPGATARRSVRVLVELLQGLGNLAIGFVIIALPLLILLSLPVLLVARMWKRAGARQAAEATDDEPDTAADD